MLDILGVKEGLEMEDTWEMDQGQREAVHCQYICSM